MKLRILLFLLSLPALVRPMPPQRPGEWRSYLAGTLTTGVAEAGNRIFALADGTLFSYGKEDSRVASYSKQTGLSDTDIQRIDYHPALKMLLILYRNGNIDLMSEDGIYNLPYLMNTSNIQDKEILNIYFHEQNAYLAARFGILILRMDKKEVAETCRLNQVVYAVCIQGNHIYAATGNGLLKASLDDNLLDVHNWTTVALGSAIQAEKIRRLGLFREMLCFHVEGSGIFYLDAQGETRTLIKHAGLTGMKIQAGRLIAHTASTLYLYESPERYETVPAGTVNDVSALNDGAYWIAAGTDGLTGVRRAAADGQYEPFVSGIVPEGPKRNLASYLTVHNRKLLVAGGGRSRTDRYRNPGTLMTLEEGKWYNFDESEVSKQTGYACRDYTCVAVDPDDETHYFVGSCGEGVLEFRNNAFVRLYNHLNTPLQSITTGADRHNYVRVQCVRYDRDKNLWITNSEVNNGIVVRKADGTWVSLFYPGINKAYFVDQILITTGGYKWVNVPHSASGPGILIFDDRGTIDDGSDDIARYYTSFKSGTGSVIDAGAYYCMAEDLNGEIWIGTDKGPVVCSSPNRAIENPDNFYCNYIIRTNETSGESNYYFLNGEQVTAIAVDGGNRKWIGTSGSGIFLVSPDGQETLLQFNASNSPLYSNNIRSIAVDHHTGEVFIGTDKGLLSYRSEAIQASETYSEVYAWPNPVRLAFDSQVLITGLMSDSNVKITDLSGNLVYQGKSSGGQLLWNCRTRNGNHVATGIYLVLASTPEAGESVVTKIAVVN